MTALWESGWQIHTIWECDLENDLSELLSTLADARNDLANRPLN